MANSIYAPPSFGDRGFFPAGSSVDAYGRSLSADQFGRPLASLNPVPTFAPSGSAFGAFGGSPLAVPAVPVTAPVNPYFTVSNVKSAPIQSGVDAILARAKALAFDPVTNTYVTRENVKSAPVQGQISSAINQYGLDVNNSRQSLKDFVTQWQMGNAEAIANQKRDAASINRVYDPAGLEADLNRNARDQSIGLRQNLNLQLAQAGGSANRARMLRGDSSYIDAQNQGAISDAVAREALANSQLGRQNILELANRRDSNAGRANTLLDQALGRGQVPLTLQQMIYGNEASRLGTLTNTNNANNFYNLDSPTQQASQEAQLMAAIQALNNQNNFYGLGAPRQEDLSGLNFPNYNIPLPRYPNINYPQQSSFPGYFSGYSEPSFGSNVLTTGAPRRAAPYIPPNWRSDPGYGELLSAGNNSGYSRNPDGSYDLLGNFNYANPSNPSDLYIPGWTPQTGANPYE
jgi:hypothetical protein